MRRVGGRTPKAFVAVPLSSSQEPRASCDSPRLSARRTRAFNGIRFQVLAIAFCSAVVALAIAYAVARRLTGRISRLKAFAEALLDRPEPDTGIGDANDEIGSLERALNGVAGQLR